MLVYVAGTPVGHTRLPSPSPGARVQDGHRVAWRLDPDTGRPQAVVVARTYQELVELPGWRPMFGPGEDEGEDFIIYLRGRSQ